MQKKIGLIGIMLVIFIISNPVFSLDKEYEKNGEVYLLIGDGIPQYKGVWALNNLTGTDPKKLYTPKAPFDKPYSLKVDRARNLYTFAKVDTGWIKPKWIKVRIYWDNNPCKRRGKGRSNRGYHAYTHNTHGYTSTNHFGHKDPVKLGAKSLGNNWYLVPNGSKYHSYDPAPMTSSFRRRAGQAYFIHTETQQTKSQEFHLLRWSQGMTDPKDEGTKASSIEKKIHRHRINGCHDGCTAGQGDQDISSTPYITKVIRSTFGNFYVFKRPVNSSQGTLTKNNQNWTDVIGYLNDISTEFLACSSKDGNQFASNDWVYLLGNRIIKEWLKQGSGGSIDTSKVNIEEVAVSDQWWQDGGIVFALDRGNNIIWKFVRDERGGNHAPPVAIPAHSNINSIATDGFGNLYFARTYREPLATASQMTVSKAYDVKWYEKNPAKGYAEGVAYFKQKVAKGIFMINYYSGVESQVGKKDAFLIGYNTYTRAVTCQPYTNPNDLKDRSKWKLHGSYNLVGKDCAIEIPTEIAVINLASPPKVEGFLPAHIDIDGPYRAIATGPNAGMLVAYSDSNPADPDCFKKYEEGKVYFFKAENEPIPDINIINNPKANRAVNTVANVNEIENVSANHMVDKYGKKSGGAKAYTWKGGFPSSIDFTTLKFKWVVKQYKDRYMLQEEIDNKNNPNYKPREFNPPKVVYDPGWSQFSTLGIALDGGEYEIELQAQYKWFDYNQLKFGAMASERFSKNVYKSATAVYCDGTTVAKYRFKVYPMVESQIKDPGRIILSDQDIKQNKGRKILSKGTYKDNNGNLFPYDYYWAVRPGNQLRFILKDLQSNINAGKDRIAMMFRKTPPAPKNVTPIPGSLQWDGPIQLSVTVDLQYPPDGKYCGPNNIYKGKGIIGEILATQVDPAKYNAVDIIVGADDPKIPGNKERTLFQIPSDPRLYKLTMTARRFYKYKSYIYMRPTPQSPPIPIPMDYRRDILIKAQTFVLVKDIYPVKRIIVDKWLKRSIANNSNFFNALREYNPATNKYGNVLVGLPYEIYGTTGDELEIGPGSRDKIKVKNPNKKVLAGQDQYDPDKDNPSTLVIYVEDDNPFGNFDGPIRNDNVYWPVNLRKFCNFHGFAHAKLWYETYAKKTGASTTKSLILLPDDCKYEKVVTQNAQAQNVAIYMKDYFDSTSTVKIGNKKVSVGKLPQISRTFGKNEIPMPDNSWTAEEKQIHKARSYLKYTIDLSQLEFFSRDKNGNWTAKLPSDYANSHPAWKGPLKIKMKFWDSSGNESGEFVIGTIIIRDNDAPNLFTRLMVLPSDEFQSMKNSFGANFYDKVEQYYIKYVPYNLDFSKVLVNRNLSDSNDPVVKHYTQNNELSTLNLTLYKIAYRKKAKYDYLNNGDWLADGVTGMLIENKLRNYKAGWYKPYTVDDKNFNMVVWGIPEDTRIWFIPILSDNIPSMTAEPLSWKLYVQDRSSRFYHEYKPGFHNMGKDGVARPSIAIFHSKNIKGDHANNYVAGTFSDNAATFVPNPDPNNPAHWIPNKRKYKFYIVVGYEEGWIPLNTGSSARIRVHTIGN